jgi:hypothetical protein
MGWTQREGGLHQASRLAGEVTGRERDRNCTRYRKGPGIDRSGCTCRPERVVVVATQRGETRMEIWWVASVLANCELIGQTLETRTIERTVVLSWRK